MDRCGIQLGAIMIKVLLVEDEVLWQQGVAALLMTESDMELAGTVDNADDGEVFFEAIQPDVVLIDWKIRGSRDGMELARTLERKLSPKRMILVTGSPAEQIPEHPYFYVPKSRIASDLVPQIRACLSHPKAPIAVNT